MRADEPPVASILPPGLVEGGAGSLQPEKRLMLAVLEGAVSDFQKYATAIGGRGRRLFTEAELWFGSTATDQPLDFESICDALGLTPSFIRDGLQRWCVARRRASSQSRTVLHFRFSRTSGTRHKVAAAG